MSLDQSTVTYKPIEGFPGYRVGDDGSVWSCLVRRGPQPGGGKGGPFVPGDTWRLKAKIKGNSFGHIRVMLSGAVMRLVHHLVLEAFVGPRPQGMQCCHNNGDPADNRLSNLRWDTPKANSADRLLHGTDKRGEKNRRAKLTDALVRSARTEFASGKATIRGLARKHHVSQKTMVQVIRGKTWRHVV